MLIRCDTCTSNAATDELVRARIYPHLSDPVDENLRAPRGDMVLAPLLSSHRDSERLWPNSAGEQARPGISIVARTGRI